MPQVTERLRKKWKAHSKWGDILKMEEKYNISNDAIGRCIRTGKGSANTIAAINHYYGINKTNLATTDIDNVN